MALLTRKRQITAKVEAAEGTFETGLDTATAPGDEGFDNADFHVISPSMTPSPLLFDRNVVKGDLTPLDQFAPGVAAIELSFGVELAGHVDNATADFVAPPLAKLLNACGFQSVPITPLGSFVDTAFDTGTVFKHGETLTGSPTASEQPCFGEHVAALDATSITDGRLWCYNVDTSPAPGNAETYTGGTTGTADTLDGTVGNDRWGFSPVSDPATVKSLSMIYFVDGKRMRIQGARGNAEFVFEHANPARIQFTFQGIVASYIDGLLIPSPLIQQKTPLASLGSGLKIADSGGGSIFSTVVYNSLSVNTNNTLTLREDSSDSDGWVAAAISARAMQGSINMDEVINTTYDIHTKMRLGTTQAMRWHVGNAITGTSANDGNNFYFRIPAFQWSSISEGNRDEVTVWDAQFTLGAGELAIDGDNAVSLGSDNEFIIYNVSEGDMNN